MTNLIDSISLQIPEDLGSKLEIAFSKVEIAFSKLAELSGNGLDHFWPLFVKQQSYEGLGAIITWSIFALCFAHYSQKLPRKDSDDIPVRLITQSFGIFALSFILLTLIVKDQVFLRILNPEYYALQEIFRIIKP